GAQLHFLAVALAQVNVGVLDKCRPFAVGRSRIAEEAPEIGPLPLCRAAALSLPALRRGIGVVVGGPVEPRRLEAFGLVVIERSLRSRRNGLGGGLGAGLAAGVTRQVARPVAAGDGELDDLG